MNTNDECKYPPDRDNVFSDIPALRQLELAMTAVNLERSQETTDMLQNALRRCYAEDVVITAIFKPTATALTAPHLETIVEFEEEEVYFLISTNDKVHNPNLAEDELVTTAEMHFKKIINELFITDSVDGIAINKGWDNVHVRKPFLRETFGEELEIVPLPPLEKAIRSFHEVGSDESFDELRTVLQDYYNNDTWVYVPTDHDQDGNNMFHIYDDQPITCIQIASSVDFLQMNGARDVIAMSFRKIMNQFAEFPIAQGVRFDATGIGANLLREHILGLMDLDDLRVRVHDWGRGIPEYETRDLLTFPEVHKIGINIVDSKYIEEGYTPLQAALHPLRVPSLVYEKDGELYFVTVETVIHPKEAALTDHKRQFLMDMAATEGAKAVYVAVEIGSEDPERFDAGIALAGDDFLYRCEREDLVINFN